MQELLTVIAPFAGCAAMGALCAAMTRRRPAPPTDAPSSSASDAPAVADGEAR